MVKKKRAVIHITWGISVISNQVEQQIKTLRVLGLLVVGIGKKRGPRLDISQVFSHLPSFSHAFVLYIHFLLIIALQLNVLYNYEVEFYHF